MQDARDLARPAPDAFPVAVVTLAKPERARDGPFGEPQPPAVESSGEQPMPVGTAKPGQPRDVDRVLGRPGSGRTAGEQPTGRPDSTS